MKDELQKWLKANVGEIILNPDPPFGINGECVNAASSWSMAIGGPELRGATAWRIWLFFRHPFFDVLQMPVAIQEGDIVFYFPNDPDIGTGEDGHVDVSTSNVTQLGFRAADANMTISGKLHPEIVLLNHSTKGVVGVFRPKGADMTKVTQLTARILSFALLGNNGLKGTKNALAGEIDNELAAYVGEDLEAMIWKFYDSEQAKRYRASFNDQVAPADPAVQAKLSQLDQIKKILGG